LLIFIAALTVFHRFCAYYTRVDLLWPVKKFTNYTFLQSAVA